jgi:K+-sensing histidine kinase KdpD
MVLDTFVYTEPEQRRDVFLSVASHELRAPLTVLKLQTQHLHQLLTRQGLSEYVAILAQMEAQIRKLERLNADVLNISNMPRGGLAYVEESVDLSQVPYETASHGGKRSSESLGSMLKGSAMSIVMNGKCLHIRPYCCHWKLFREAMFVFDLQRVCLP